MPTTEGQQPTQPVRSSTASQRSPEFEYAMDLALQGFAVFPLHPGTKAPLGKYWEQAASTDPRRIARWWTTNPHANIAIACGPSNLLVIDLDAAKQPGQTHHGQQTLTTLAAGREIPRTFTVTSARDGRHLYYRQPDGLTLRNTTGSKTSGLGPLIDTRGYGGYIVAPGSTFTGRTYRIERDAPVAPLPPWIAAELENRRSSIPPATEAAPPATAISDRLRTAYGTAALRHAADSVASAPEGTRNHTLNREAFRLGRLVGGGILNHDDATTTLRDAARRAGLEPRETNNTITSGLTAGIRQPRSVPIRKPAPQTNRNATEAAMSTTTDTSQTTTPANFAPPNPAEPHSHTATPEPAPAIQPHETVESSETSTRISTETAPTPTPEPETPLKTARETEDGTSPEAAFNFEEVWTDVQAKIERARQALPDVPTFRTFDQVHQAISELRSALAQTPLSLRDPADDSSNSAPQAEALAQDSVGNLDAHLAAVDIAYAEAQATGIPTTTPEWVGISAIHTATHNLWDTIKAAAGSYWTELAADTRVHGFLTTLATRAALTIANLANTAANRLEQRASPQRLGAVTAEPSLREAYLNARNHIRANAATHEWQRITALWGTINTLTRQTDNPGIRAIVAHSTDALSGFAETLSRRAMEFGGQDDVTDAIDGLARAAQRHAASLRGIEPESGLQCQANAAFSQQGADTQALLARARQVAQHAQARLGQDPRKAPSAPRRPFSAGNENNQSAITQPMQPAAAAERAGIQMR
jgi:Bifunctional DNA primase/polymerase, N-terminal